MIRKQTEIEVGFWNENFISSETEDCRILLPIKLLLVAKSEEFMIISIILNMVGHLILTIIIQSSWTITTFGRI
jgi:hypothetical protein